MLARLLTESLHKQRVDGSIDPVPVICPLDGLPDEPLNCLDGAPAGLPTADPVTIGLMVTADAGRWGT
jgi:hypothetical protein